MTKIRSSNNWWMWGQPQKRKSLNEYPKFRNYMESLWGKVFNDKMLISDEFEVDSNEERAEKVFSLFNSNLPGIRLSKDPAVRLQKSLGKSYPDWLTAVSSIPAEIPDAVIYPKTHEEVCSILNLASENRILIFPYGGGTNVVGAFKIPGRKEQPRIVIDLSEMNQLLSFDAENCTATFQCGILGPELEKILNSKGFTLGHFPQSFEFSTLGGWIATRSAGQESSTYGRIEDIAVSLKAATPTGSLLTSDYEGDAQGINMKFLLFGSEGMLGVVTEAKVRIHHIPECKEWVVALFPEFQSGISALRELIQSGVHPSVVRYSDARETFFLSLMSNEIPTVTSKIKSRLTKAVLKWKNLKEPCLLMVRMDGSREDARFNKNITLQVFSKHQGFSVSERIGKKWETTRFGLPYLRDDLLERGVFIDTMETVFPWNQVAEIQSKLNTVLKLSEDFGAEKGILLSHVSHVYGSCASIYFTIITKQNKEQRIEQWKNIKTLVTDTIVSNGGAVSHHHSVGTDHRKWYLQKTDTLTKQILRNVKNTVDPHHILNPGKLFDE